MTILWNWVTFVKSGKVEKLTLRQFNFYPTEWFVVLDEEVVIFGHYYYDEENIARAKSTETKFVVRNIPGSGDNLVRSYIKKFDELFNECETNFGVNWGVITSVDTGLTAGHWPSSI